LVIEYGHRLYPSLALATVVLDRHVAAMQVAIDRWGAWRMRLDSRLIPLEGRTSLRMRFRGKHRQFRYVSAADVLNAGAPEGSLRGKIAIVGGSAAGVDNPVVTALDPLFPNVEIQATAIDNLLEGDSSRRPGDARFWELALALLAGSITALIFTRPHFLWGAVAGAVLVAGVWAGCAAVVSSIGMLFSPLPATAVVACELPVLILFNYLREKASAGRTQKQLVSTAQRSRDALRESESRYQRLVENVNDAIIVDDVEGRLVFANRRFREWFGLRDADSRDVVLEDFVAPEWRTELRGCHDRRMRGETVPDHFEFEGIRADGTRVWIEALVTLIEEDGRIIGSQAALRDTTERKRMEAQYLQAQKMESVGRLAGGVAHDFNNLLTIINGYSRMLVDALDPGSPLREPLEEIGRAGERAAGLTQQLLAFSRKQILQPRVLDLNGVVDDMKPMLARLMGEDVEVRVRVHPEAATIHADQHQLEQVVMNLAVNSRDAMPRGGKFRIETSVVQWGEAEVRGHPGARAGWYVVLAVSDDGEGMNEETRRRMFEPFFTTKRVGKGTGLGLSMVQGIVEQSGGYIEVRSAPGIETTFSIYLPMVQDAQADGEKPEPATATGGHETVLVVEDQAEVRRYAAVALTAYGYRVVQAETAAEALLICNRERERIDLVLTDVVMPNLSGGELAGRLRERWPNIKVLFMSGYAGDTILHHAVLDDGAELIQKPFSPDQLAARVRKVLAA
jgi:PAS domain S-box-containing protein